MKLSENFTLEEFINSSTADKRGIDNRPSADEHRNIQKLVSTIMQPIREKFGKPIIVSSGFRCSRLNQAVGGASNSDHIFGAACDFHTVENTKEANKKLFELILNMIDNKEIQCRQLIDEYNYKWIHISINHSKNKTKNNQILHIK